MANFESIKKKTDAQAAEKIAETNKIYDDQYAATEKIYQDQIDASDASYAKVYDRANVQRIVNERYAKEMAANMGLSNSGYNRTQQTQIMLSYNNAVLETDYQKAAAANTIRSQLASIKADIEAQKASSALSIKDSYDKLATDTYNQQLAAEQAAVTARNNQQQSDYANLREFLFNDKYNDRQKALQIYAYCSTYGVDDQQFLDLIGMSISNYKTFLGYSSGNNNNNKGLPEINFNYKDDKGTLVPGRNGFTIVYKNGYSRPATEDEIKAGKSLTGANSSSQKGNTTTKHPIPDWQYTFGIGS